jgi:hypothetical protein
MHTSSRWGGAGCNFVLSLSSVYTYVAHSTAGLSMAECAIMAHPCIGREELVWVVQQG